MKVLISHSGGAVGIEPPTPNCILYSLVQLIKGKKQDFAPPNIEPENCWDLFEI